MNEGLGELRVSQTLFSQVHGQGIILQKIVSFSFFVKVPKEQAFRNTSPRIVYVTALQVICLNPAVM